MLSAFADALLASRFTALAMIVALRRFTPQASTRQVARSSTPTSESSKRCVSPDSRRKDAIAASSRPASRSADSRSSIADAGGARRGGELLAFAGELWRAATSQQVLGCCLDFNNPFDRPWSTKRVRFMTEVKSLLFLFLLYPHIMPHAMAGFIRGPSRARTMHAQHSTDRVEFIVGPLSKAPPPPVIFDDVVSTLPSMSGKTLAITGTTSGTGRDPRQRCGESWRSSTAPQSPE